MNHTPQSSPARNEISLVSNGVLLAVETGQQTVASITLLSGQLARKIMQLRRQVEWKVLVLVDLSRVTGYDPDAQEAAQELLLHMDFDALAIFGASEQFRHANKALVKSVHQLHRVQFFDTAEAAANWLAGDVIQQDSSVESLAHPILPPRRQKRTM